MKLNNSQQKAVYCPNKPVLVLAGAGTGKTRVLEARIIKLIQEDHIDHNKILVITFTNKARNEIFNRLIKRIDKTKIPRNISTFHAFFKWLLEQDIGQLDKALIGFSILDQDGQIAFIRKLLRQHKVRTSEGDECEPEKVVNALGILKIKTIGLENLESVSGESEIQGVSLKDLINIYEKYQDELKLRKHVDFNDLEIFTYKALQKQETRRRWKEYFKALLIDEFQDTSYLQLEILKLLADSKSNIFCVGDPHQSIYGFRGAHPEVCKDFIFHFQAECIKLEDNYRSTQLILDVADHILAKTSPNSLDKKLKSIKEHYGDKVKCLCFSQRKREASFVIDQIQSLIASNPHLKLRDFVILYRSNFYLRLFESELVARKINYEVLNSETSYMQEEIRFILSILKFIFVPKDKRNIQFLRDVFYELDFRINDFSYKKFITFYWDNSHNLDSAIEEIHNSNLEKDFIQQITTFWKKIIELRHFIHEPLTYLVERIFISFNYEQIIRSHKEEGKIERIRNYIVNIMRDLGDIGDASRTLTNTKTIKDIPLWNKPKNKKDFLSIGTVHQAKGLEYEFVFVVGMNNYIFPSKRSKTNEEFQEERRLAHVAFTRAKEKLWITFVSKSSESNSEDNYSVFIQEIRQLSDKVEFTTPNIEYVKVKPQESPEKPKQSANKRGKVFKIVLAYCLKKQSSKCDDYSQIRNKQELVHKSTLVINKYLSNKDIDIKTHWGINEDKCDFALLWRDIKKKPRGIMIKCLHNDFRDENLEKELIEIDLEKLEIYRKWAHIKHKAKFDIRVLLIDFPLRNRLGLRIHGNIVILNFSLLNEFIRGVNDFYNKSKTTDIPRKSS